MAKKKKNNKKVFVGLSGGVDSSVAALLLKKQGYDVTGVFLRCFNVDGCAKHDAEDARRVAEHLNIPFYTFDLEEEYKQKVVNYMIKEYREGLTPNPDVACNREIKFGLFMDKALEMGADYIATGHYVKLLKKEEYYSLYIAEDGNKDQSYFLWKLNQEDLKKSLFPVGDYPKPKVREIAREANLSTADKKDSQGICFLGQVDLKDFLKDYIPPSKGDVLDTKGNKIGEHEGVQYYTIGQRHVGVDNPKSSKKGETKPYYVAEKNVEDNTLIMAEGKDNPALFKEKINLRDINFIRPIEFDELNVKARVRYRQPLFDAVLKNNDGDISLKFENSQKFIAPGQSAVFYASDGECLGGGVIK
ncbi:MAG TPA: tRNA 2-thiouridine(34) synthase MnmA [Candidatus Paceibacterota bacterium]|nr:tRNA 2-thiouridine(34) synthase MnmA [Candidatus Paceibacterota bacterium]